LLDTGSTLAVLAPDILTDIGCDLSHPRDTVPFQSFGISAYAPVILVPSYTVIGRTVHDVEAVALRMPPNSALDGVLGLNILHALGMRIDFRAGVLEVDDDS
jgi:predicted aspartyl protease